MNETTNPEQQSGPEAPVSPSAPSLPSAPPQAPAAPVFDPRRRLRELLSIPESQRTDPQWDEIIELEVQLAPGNRIGQETPSGGKRSGHPHQGQGGNKGGGGGGPPGGSSPGGANFKRHGPRKFQKPKKPPQA